MGQLSSLQHPERSHRKAVTLPRHSIAFAEFMGIMMGDGGINNPWQANITLNSEADASYINYVKELPRVLFGIDPVVRKRKERQATVISIASTSVVDFLVESGLPRGNKIKGGLHIPLWIWEKPAYRKACVRGLMDTDGCLYIHKHQVLGKQYENIGLCFTAYAPVLMEQVAAAFVESGIMPHISRQGRCLYLYQESAVARYLKIYGTSNDRISAVYKKFGGVG